MPTEKEFVRDKHISYLKRGLTLLPKQYASNDTNRYFQLKIQFFLEKIFFFKFFFLS